MSWSHRIGAIIQVLTGQIKPPHSVPDTCSKLATCALFLLAAIGVHTGPVVAGVIGTKKHAYDIWGDTVNIASRMESHGVPGRVHVSDTVRQELGKRYNCEKRGMIEVKNRGELRTWFVNGLAVLSPDENPESG